MLTVALSITSGQTLSRELGNQNYQKAIDVMKYASLSSLCAVPRCLYHYCLCPIYPAPLEFISGGAIDDTSDLQTGFIRDTEPRLPPLWQQGLFVMDLRI